MIWSHNQKPVSLALQDEREWWGQSSFESDNTLSHDLTTDKQQKLCVGLTFFNGIKHEIYYVN